MSGNFSDLSQCVKILPIGDSAALDNIIATCRNHHQELIGFQKEEPDLSRAEYRFWCLLLPKLDQQPVWTLGVALCTTPEDQAMAVDIADWIHDHSALMCMRLVVDHLFPSEFFQSLQARGISAVRLDLGFGSHGRPFLNEAAAASDAVMFSDIHQQGVAAKLAEMFVQMFLS